MAFGRRKVCRWRTLANGVFVLALPLCSVLAQTPVRPALPRGLDHFFPVPFASPLTREAVELGARLFRDPILSRDRSLACADCHDPERAFTDGRPTSVGISGRPGRRNVPTLINRVYGETFFWDGRTSTLEQQVTRPIEEPTEMDLDLAEAVLRLRVDQRYANLFVDAFGRIPTRDALARALAAYVRTILSGDAPVDRFLSGESDALSPRAQMGLQLFRGRANCTTCHTGPTFTDEKFHNTGVAWQDGAIRDRGRALVSGDEADTGAFKTPTLRNIGMTAPYMHDGSVRTLEEVVEFYDQGGNANPYLDREVRALTLSRLEKASLVEFLHSLDGSAQDGL